MIRPALYLLLFYLCAGSSQPRAQQLFSERAVTVRWMEFHSDSLNDFIQSLKQQGPKDEDGIARYAVTEWTLSWNFTVDAKKEFVSKANITAEVDIILPLWKPQILPAPEEYDAWRRMYGILLHHEFGHASHPLRRAKELQTYFRKHQTETRIPIKTSHKLLQGEVNAARQWDFHFDRETDHGNSELRKISF